MTINHYLNTSIRYLNFDSHSKYINKYDNYFMIYYKRYDNFFLNSKYSLLPPSKNKKFSSQLFTGPPPFPKPPVPPPPPPPPLFLNKKPVKKYTYDKYYNSSNILNSNKKSSIFYLPPLKDKKYNSIGTNTDKNNIETNNNDKYDHIFNDLLNNINNFRFDKLSEIKNKNTTEKNNDIEEKKEEERLKKEFKILEGPIETLDDLIRLGKDYEEKYKSEEIRYNLNIQKLSEMVNELEDLNKMIGMQNIKKAIFNKIILTLQGLNNKHLDYNHIVLYGSPGMGKTHVAKLIGAVYSKMGFLSKGNFEQAKLTDLKAGYLGQTEIKTQKLLDKCKGSVLFIDEAYSIGGEDKIDSFSQAIIDVINPFLDKYRDDFVLIIAGYKKDLDNRFFSANQGLKSRFGLWLEIDKYTPEDLFKIFNLKVKEYKWSVCDDINKEFFAENIDYFPYFGRDIENFFSKCKIEHAKRVLFLQECDKKLLNLADLKNGLELFIKNNGINKEAEDQIKLLHQGLYS